MLRALEKIEQAQSVLVIGHVSPDGDSLGSTIGLYHLLRERGKTTYAMCVDRVPSKFSYLVEGIELVTHICDFPRVELMILVDCGELKRAGLPEDVSTEIVNIDHHASNLGALGTAWVDPSYAAVGQQIFEMARAAHWPISPLVATCLYTALATDTGSFRHMNTTPKALRDAAALMELGADVETVVEQALEQKSLGELCLVAKALAALSQECEGRVSIIEIPAHVFAECKVELNDAEGVVEYAKAVPGTVIAILLREATPHTTRVSLRSRGVFDVSSIAVSFGGGGHKLASGCTIEAPLPVARQKLLDEITEVLRHG